jgi:hypothetical protein
MILKSISLLDEEGFLKHKELIRPLMSRWWLKSKPRSMNYCVHCVAGPSTIGAVSSNCVEGIRPVCNFEIEITDPMFWSKPSKLIGSTLVFGNYEWIILEIEGGRLFAICDTIIGDNYFSLCKEYGPCGPCPVEWDTSELKVWLETEGVKLINS